MAKSKTSVPSDHDCDGGACGPEPKLLTELNFNARNLYDIYKVKIACRERLYGSTPKSAELIRIWLETRTKKNKSITPADVDQMVSDAESVLVSNKEDEDKSWTGFQGDEHGLFVSTNNVKAMLKQGASILGFTIKKRGSKQILAEGMEVKGLKRPSRLYFDKTEPDGCEERPIHITGPQGKRNALKRSEYMENPVLEFEVWVLKTASSEIRHIGEKELRTILAFSQENGVGGDRSQGAGKFDVTEFAKVA
jgi:hypothetical protein